MILVELKKLIIFLARAKITKYDLAGKKSRFSLIGWRFRDVTGSVALQSSYVEIRENGQRVLKQFFPLILTPRNGKRKKLEIFWDKAFGSLMFSKDQKFNLKIVNFLFSARAYFPPLPQYSLHFPSPYPSHPKAWKMMKTWKVGLGGSFTIFFHKGWPPWLVLLLFHAFGWEGYNEWR